MEKNEITVAFDKSDDITFRDFLTVIFIGSIGAAAGNSKALNNLLDQVHEDASLRNPKTLLGKLLHHNGDIIDTVSRGGKIFAPYLHRLYGGHDILSFWHGDNPFVLLCGQYGIPKGIIQVVRHLVADTFSKNGCVLPGSSFLDRKTEDGTIVNLLDEWAREMCRGKNFNVQVVYQQLFSIRMQDMGATFVSDMLLKIYEKSVAVSEKRHFSDTANSQLRIIMFFAEAVMTAGLGALISGGIPKVNIPAVSALIFEAGHLFYINHADVKAAKKRGDELEFRFHKLEQS